MQDFEMGDLNLVFNELYKNDLDARAFKVKPKEIQKMDLIAIIQKHHQSASMGTSVGEGSMTRATDGVSSGDDAK